MDPELQKQLAVLLAKLMDVAQQGATWTAGQIPPLVQEKVWLGRAEETAWMLILTLWMVLMLWQVRRLIPWALRLTKEDEDMVPAFLLPVLVGAVGFIPWQAQLHPFALVWFAPRLYIVEWLSGLIKK